MVPLWAKANTYNNNEEFQLGDKEFLDAFGRDPDEESIAVFQSGGDKGMDKFFCVSRGFEYSWPEKTMLGIFDDRT
ncbi:hypothetical protein DPEC_G00043360 [Dallia pectoralis]|uniref:Uncharacterized protein n=1 Tax=Dallia pectoralis TaxID=75939 RepID=A0ACC2H923_DALPE|nr:hypothetical protein DPEC_G00043360 [Dallia pectoralis]